jgi:hypothetical protein
MQWELKRLVAGFRRRRCVGIGTSGELRNSCTRAEMSECRPQEKIQRKSLLSRNVFISVAKTMNRS